MSDERPSQPPTEDELHELALIANRAIDNFGGNSSELEGALGMLFVGRRYGWRVVMLIHDRRTVRKYQKILGIDVREQFPAVGDRADKSLGFQAVKKVSNFWKAVRGEIKGVKNPELDR